MTDPGWDLPGVQRDAPPAAAPVLVAPVLVAPVLVAPDPSSARLSGSPVGAGVRRTDDALAGAGRQRAGDAPTAAFSRRADDVSTAAFARRVDHAAPCAFSRRADDVSTAPFARRVADAPTAVFPRSTDDVPTDAGATPADSMVTASDPAEALAFLRAGLEFLAHADAADWPAAVQADCLRALAAAEARQAAAHARVLAAFSVPGGGLAADGHRSPRTWLTWQTRATRRAATVHVARMRGLAEHPLIAAALADGTLSVSWARQLMEWSDQLPADRRHDADEQLLAAAARTASLSDLFRIFEELRREAASADTDPDDGFADRSVQFATTFDGAGRIEGDLTSRCAAAVDAVLGSLATRRGPEDARTLGQRQHDALEEACTRLLAAGCLPERAGQPVRLELNITLDELARNGDGSAAGPGIACDATIQPIVTGTVDYQLLDQLAGLDRTDELAAATGTLTAGDPAAAVLAHAIALLSGPTGYAAALRRNLAGPVASISLPLDIAGTFDTMPVHLRRAVRDRDRHCRFPGCDVPAAACDVHHLQHRKDGGRHALTNLALFCRFHHLVAIHRWGWEVTLRPDGTTTARSPDGAKTLHSHPPPGQVA